MTKQSYVGALAFGEPFGAVENGKTHFWIETVVKSTYWQLLYSLRSKFSLLQFILPFFIPSDAAPKQAKFAAYTEEKISRRIALQDEDHQRDFFDDALNSGELSEAVIKGQAGVLIIAGSDTASTTLSAASYFLLKHPECRETLTKEIRGAFASAEDITDSALQKLPYLHGVLEETLRIFPTVPFGLPRVSPGEVVDGEYIPAGVEVSAANWQLGHDTRYWKNPWSFVPERWIGDGFGDKTSVYHPFGYGPRSCIGEALAYMELRIIIAKMIFAYDWEWLNPDLDWFRDSRYLGVWDKAALKVKFHLRKDQAT